MRAAPVNAALLPTPAAALHGRYAGRMSAPADDAGARPVPESVRVITR